MGIEDIFPNLLESAYHVTSPVTDQYNCVAWAMGRDDGWWWPLGDFKKSEWPEGVSRLETIEVFCEAFATLGYVKCGRNDTEQGFERIALYAGNDGIPTHVARQISSGLWTSKLGSLEDIQHGLAQLEGAEYGSVVQIMKRPLFVSPG